MKAKLSFTADIPVRVGVLPFWISHLSFVPFFFLSKPVQGCLKRFFFLRGDENIKSLICVKQKTNQEISMGGAYSTDAAQGYLLSDATPKVDASAAVSIPTPVSQIAPVNHVALQKTNAVPPPECPMHAQLAAQAAAAPPAVVSEEAHMAQLAEVPSECPMADQLNAER